MVCSQAKEGLRPESAREGEHSATEECAHREPRALEQPWAEGQCGGAHGKEGPESNAIWRGGDREDPFLPSPNHLTKPSEAETSCPEEPGFFASNCPEFRKQGGRRRKLGEKTEPNGWL